MVAITSHANHIVFLKISENYLLRFQFEAKGVHKILIITVLPLVLEQGCSELTSLDSVEVLQYFGISSS